MFSISEIRSAIIIALVAAVPLLGASLAPEHNSGSADSNSHVGSTVQHGFSAVIYHG